MELIKTQHDVISIKRKIYELGNTTALVKLKKRVIELDSLFVETNNEFCELLAFLSGVRRNIHFDKLLTLLTQEAFEGLETPGGNFFTVVINLGNFS